MKNKASSFSIVCCKPLFDAFTTAANSKKTIGWALRAYSKTNPSWVK
jgi:3-methyladenine DNA glycosylase AlkD